MKGTRPRTETLFRRGELALQVRAELRETRLNAADATARPTAHLRLMAATVVL